MVGRQAWFAAEMTRRYAGHPAVAGWLVSNEMPLYGGSTTDHETVAAWGRIIRDAVRAAGGRQPFSLGDGAWGIEVTGVDNGFRLTDLAEISDFFGPHTYPVGDDPIRQRYAAALACELAGTFGKPVTMEEFGVSSDFASDDNAATYYRHLLHGTLLAGATGWVAWNNTDLALAGQDPYRHHAFEQNFGLTDTRQAEGDAAEMRDVARDRPHQDRASRHRHRPHRLVLPGHRVPVHVAGEPPAPWHCGPSDGSMNELFGIRQQLDVGIGDRIEDDTVRLTFTRDFGGPARGSTLDFKAAGREIALDLALSHIKSCLTE